MVLDISTSLSLARFFPFFAPFFLLICSNALSASTTSASGLSGTAGDHNNQIQVQNEDHQETILFGSCNRQNLPQDYWDSFEVFEAKNFIWTGDAVYTENSQVNGLQSALESLSSNEHYLRFRNRTRIYGTWDDHDFGVNDGGKRVSEIPMRKQLYLSFLNSSSNVSSSSTSSATFSSLSHPQDEIFHTFVIGKAPAAIRFILLDNRSYREDHWIRSLGEYKFIPLSALFAAGIRLIYTSLGYGLDHSADILGEKQWDWLEQVLQRSTGHAQEEDFTRADFHVVVSSVQIFTSNPIVESWNHFPVAKKRLIALFQKYNPSGLVFLSGDIHASEISTATVHYSFPSRLSSQWYEITSSGLTHNCRGSFITRSICPIMMNFYHTHRLTHSATNENDTTDPEKLSSQSSSSSPTLDRDRYFMEKNVGLIRSYLTEGSDETCSSSSYLEIEVYPVPLSTTPVLHQRIYPHHHPKSQLKGEDGEVSKVAPTICDVEYVTFPHFSDTVSLSLLISALCGLVALISSVILLFRSS